MPHVLSRIAGSGWLPSTLLLLMTFAVLVAYGTTPRDVVAFAVYIILGVAVPGMLWVRFLRDRSEHVAEDLAMGLALGYCVEVGAYTVSRMAGVPLLVLLWPVVTVTAFLVHRPLRRFWRFAAVSAPAWWSWSLVTILGLLLAYSARNFFAIHPVAGEHEAYVDLSYHLALIGELRHHAPAEIPYVTDTPLAYHWFAYADAAATSWATGIEPLNLLYRLSAIPMFAAVVLLTAAGAQRVAGRWAGPLAVVIALAATAAAPYAWTTFPVFDAQTLATTWTSPTNLFGLVIVSAAIVALIDVLREGTPSPARRWILIAVLAFGAAGAKSTLLPLLLVGLVGVLVTHAIARRRLHRAALMSTAILGLTFVLGLVFVYQGSSGGLVIGLESLRVFGVAVPALDIPRLQVLAPVVALVVALALWSFLWAGAFGLLARGRSALEDPALGLLAGICLAALGAVTLLAFPGSSQLYFARGAAPAFGILAAAGIAAVIPTPFRLVPHAALVTISAGVGALGVLLITIFGPALPAPTGLGLRSYTFTVLAPIALLLVFTLAMLALLRAAGRRWDVIHRLAPVMLIGFVMGFSIPNTVRQLTTQTAFRPTALAVMPDGGVASARWLRANSDPSDLVATNLHCRVLAARCDARHFWVSGMAERRMLVEGWAYTQRAIDIGMATDTNPRRVPFWDPELLALNDAAFETPSAEILTTLRDRYGVRWLFASVALADAESLAGLATLRYRVGDFAVYELAPTP